MSVLILFMNDILFFISVLLYVREKHEVVFTAVMLRSPTLLGLLQAVSNNRVFENNNDCFSVTNCH